MHALACDVMGNACRTCMHYPVMCMHRHACTYCMGSKDSIWSLIYLTPATLVVLVSIAQVSIRTGFFKTGVCKIDVLRSRVLRIGVHGSIGPWKIANIHQQTKKWWQDLSSFKADLCCCFKFSIKRAILTQHNTIKSIWSNVFYL